MALIFSQFLSTDGGLQIANVLAISTIFTLNYCVAFSIWAAVGDKIVNKFRTDEGAMRLNLMFGMILAAVAIWMFFS
jgi:threonine/homoserine/homoserine lactone efflux protein